MPNRKLRLITFISLFLIIISLKFIANLSNNIIISIAIIMLFLILFTYVFKTEGHKLLKFFVVACSFIALPLFILYYLGVFSSITSSWGGVLMVGTVTVFGMTAVFAIYSLDYVVIHYERIDDK